MIVFALTWPEAAVYVALIAAAGLVVAVLVWSIFRTGQTAIKEETSQRKIVDALRADVDQLRSELHGVTQRP
jgi:hypothetical protein